jgi:DEAD/DEAH box helicase domain-containing protein
VYYEKGIIYLYDNSSDGFNGCSRIIYEEFEKVLSTGFSLLQDCDCPTDKTQKDEKEWGGCPKCTFTTNYCQTKNKELSKKGAKEFFSAFQS